MLLIAKMSQDSVEGLPRFIGHNVLALDAGDDSGRTTAAAAHFHGSRMNEISGDISSENA